MTYMRSRARIEFETKLTHTTIELVPLYKHAQAHGGGSRLLAAYYVLAYAELEVYLRTLVEDSLVALSSSSPSLDRIPDSMLGYLLHKSEKLAANYRRFSVDDDEGAVLKKVAQTAKKIASWSNGSAILTSADANEFLDKKAYPSPKNLPQLFRRLGVESIWTVIDRVGRMNCKLILTSLNDLRTGIAHQGRVSPGFSLIDFRERLDQMRRFVAALDRGLSNHFCPRMIARADWNSSMT
jgi:hypothetical protein